MSKKKGLIAGLLAGAAAGLLFAPKKGKELRKDIDKELKKRKFYDSKFYRFFKETVQEIKEEGKEVIEDMEDFAKKQEGKILPKGSVSKAKSKLKGALKKEEDSTKPKKTAKKTTKKKTSTKKKES